MAGNNMKAIKNRIKSVESTKQITKAMQLVASSKLRRAKDNAEKAKPFYSSLKSTLCNIVNSFEMDTSPLLKDNSNSKSCYIIIAGDRGLAGGYNNNVFKLAKTKIDDDDCIIPIGKKSIEHYSKRNVEKLTKDYEVVAALGVGDALDIGQLVVNKYKNGEIGNVYIIYTKFVSMLTQEVQFEKILPLSKDDFEVDNEVKSDSLTTFDFDESEIADRVITQYVSGIIYAAIRESFAAECAARRTAMESATDNATEMIDELTLHFNRARQAAITQEITEVVSGAEA